MELGKNREFVPRRAHLVGINWWYYLRQKHIKTKRYAQMERPALMVKQSEKHFPSSALRVRWKVLLHTMLSGIVYRLALP